MRYELTGKQRENLPLRIGHLHPTSFPGLFPLNLGGAGLPNSMGKALGTRLTYTGNVFL